MFAVDRHGIVYLPLYIILNPENGELIDVTRNDWDAVMARAWGLVVLTTNF